MKNLQLVENIAKLQLVENAEIGNKRFTAIASKVGTVNRNGLYLDGDVIEMDREKYPFLFNHGKSANDLIGSCVTKFNAEQSAYITEFEVFENKLEIQKAIEGGVFDSVSISYYIDEYNFGENDEIVVKHATMNEVSLVSVGADPDAKIINNELEAEKKAFIEAKNKLKELKKSYE